MRRAISPAICLNTTRVSVALHRHDVLLVHGGALLPAGDLETALLILHFADDPADRRAVHVHVEDVQKDADAIQVRAAPP